MGLSHDNMNAIAYLCIAGALVAVVLGLAAAVLRRPSWIHWLFFTGMIVLAAESAFAALSLLAGSTDEAVRWQIWRLAAASFVPGIWVLFSLTYSRGNPKEHVSKWRSVLIMASSLPLLALLGFQEVWLGIQQHVVQLDGMFRLSWVGSGIHIGLLLSSIIILMNAERTFRASTGTMRWRIKHLIFGLALLFGVRVYTSSQAVLFSAIDPALDVLQASGLILACGLMGWSHLRSGFFGVDLYPSSTFYHSSITLFVTGLYLLIVGVLANLVTLLGTPGGLPLKALLIMVSLVVLAMALVSERIRERSKRFINHHFKRPTHNYRQVWTAFAQGASSHVDEKELCREATKLVSDTFQVLSVTIWLIDEQQQLVFGASTSLLGKQSYNLIRGHSDIAGLIEGMRRRPEPVDIDTSQEEWVETIKRCNPDFFKTGGNRVCMPLTQRGEVLGLISLGDRVNAIPFSSEDKDLLKCIGDQLAASFHNLQLSKKLLRARELEAFQSMSAFFVHDLKNTVHSLSLLMQNFTTHFDDPEFRADARRAVSNSVRHLNELIGRLSLLRQKLDINATPTDLNSLISASIENLQLSCPDRITCDFQPLPHVSCDPEHITKVVTNLVLNAWDASGDERVVNVSTAAEKDCAVIAIRDKGCGMTLDFINESLFRPFQTTKKSGLGIGLYHTKMIVEAHKGKIEVESKPGSGTLFRVFLPFQR
jgi:putative PEP-CTERM system histidine kinase